ncbi:NAD-P-binding protein [Cristinia sonorae]|uniref:NAD-P-binding protein n=1 Tax=Cristinia sonorae TaxID=1940300 RepID=A0A8K0UNR7_9AGAR|nr:NAD-P-binding protein [Cristinia sonorae]
MTKETTWLITGSSRGIGLEFVRQLSASPDNIVIATCRSPDTASDLKTVASKAQGTVHIVPLDISNPESIAAIEKSVKNILGDGPLDYLVNNAGILTGLDTAFDFLLEDFIKTMSTNVAGPAKVTEALLPYLERGERPVVLNMGSGVGSITNDSGAKRTIYSMSKAALNMLTYKQAKAKPNIIFLVVDPGWVKTDMGGGSAFLEPAFTVSGQLKLLESITLEQSGKFLRHDGEHVPW